MAGDLEATFGIQIPVETNADDAAASLENLREQIIADTTEVRSMQAALRNLQGGTNVNIETFKSLRTAIAAKKVALAQATQAVTAHKNAFAPLSAAQKKAQSEAEAFRKEQEKLSAEGKREFTSGMAHALGVLSPRLGHAVRGLQDFKQSANAMGAARGIAVGATTAIAVGFAAVAAASIAMTYGIAKATASLVEFGVAAADARRDERLMLQAASATLWWGQATETAGKQAQMAVDNVASHVPIARSEVAGYAAQLAKAQLKGQDLQKALKAVSIAASAGQDTGGIIGAFSMARFGVGNVDALADRIESKFGGVVAERMLSMSVQTQKLKENFAGLFSKVDLKPLLEGVQSLFGLFDKTTVTGYAMREVFSSVLTLFGKDFKSATPIVKELFERMLIFTLRGILGFLQLRKTVKDFLSEHPKLVAFFADANTYVSALKIAFDFLGSTIKAAFGPLGEALATIKELYGLLTGKPPSGEGVGEDFATGVGLGIGKKIGEVAGKAKELGSRAIKALRDVWDSHSPSKLTEKLGEDIGEGKVIGLRKAAPRVAAATADALGPSSGTGGTARAAGGRGGPVHLHFHITVPPGTKDPEAFGKQMGQAMRGELDDLLERMAQLAGAPLEQVA